MKRPVSFCLLAALLLGGCVSRYDVLLRNNQIITAKSKPREDGHGNYVFTDIEGKKATVPVGRVLMIEPRSFWGGGSSNHNFKFIPAN